MSFAKLSPAQAASIKLAKDHSNDATRKAIKKEVFAAARLAFGIPAEHKLNAEIDPTNPSYGLLRNSTTRDVYRLGTDGRWVNAAPVAAPADPKRWFKVTNVAETLTDALNYTDTFAWSEGSTAAPTGTDISKDEYHAIVTPTGDVYIGLEEAEL